MEVGSGGAVLPWRNHALRCNPRNSPLNSERGLAAFRRRDFKTAESEFAKAAMPASPVVTTATA